MFTWEAEDKYNELKTFMLEVNNILSTYNSSQNEQLTMVKKWLGTKGLWAKRVEAQRAQADAMKSITEQKDIKTPRHLGNTNCHYNN